MTTPTAQARRVLELVLLAEFRGDLESWRGALAATISLRALLDQRVAFERRVNAPKAARARGTSARENLPP